MGIIRWGCESEDVGGSVGGWVIFFIIVSYDCICLYLQNKLQRRTPWLGMD
jgi:hypothetical protein